MNKVKGSQPFGPGRFIQAANGCSPVTTMCLAIVNTSTHLQASTSRKNQRILYPNSAPALEEKISSPAPIVSEAMIAPGPKIANQRSGFFEMSAAGTGAPGKA